MESEPVLTTTSILDSEYVEPNRPISQNELLEMRNNLYRTLRLSKVRAEHGKCGHFYFVHKNSKKELEILKTKDSDSGKCSVCWKQYNMNNKDLKGKAVSLTNTYCNTFFTDPEYMTYRKVDLETVFYQWLYEK
jgi:hypothetical protein|uniref:Uncharacterized protein n=1 Tax=viral metagenome TaxID=1070528 RepID=A0A6C0CYT4_9ZZZZ